MLLFKDYFNPAWRKWKLEQIKREKAAKRRDLNVNLDVINTLISGLKHSEEQEIELQYYGKYDAEAVKELGSQHGLYRWKPLQSPSKFF